MKVKICGVTHPKDAEEAARFGADYIGIIFSPRSKRNVSLPLAKAIADASRGAGAEPVGIFVEQTTDQIHSICEETRIEVVQLHGELARKSLHVLLGKYEILYALSEPLLLPDSVIPLYDSGQGGTGLPFDWKSFSPPKNRQWILAGGLNPSNVAQAISLLKPSGVDVATGVEYPFSTRKDPHLVKNFILAAKQRGKEL